MQNPLDDLLLQRIEQRLSFVIRAAILFFVIVLAGDLLIAGSARGPEDDVIRIVAAVINGGMALLSLSVLNFATTSDREFRERLEQIVDASDGDTAHTRWQPMLSRTVIVVPALCLAAVFGLCGLAFLAA